MAIGIPPRRDYSCVRRRERLEAAASHLINTLMIVTYSYYYYAPVGGSTACKPDESSGTLYGWWTRGGLVVHFGSSRHPPGESILPLPIFIRVLLSGGVSRFKSSNHAHPNSSMNVPHADTAQTIWRSLDAAIRIFEEA